MNRFLSYLQAMGPITSEPKMLTSNIFTMSLLITSPEHIQKWGDKSATYLNLKWRNDVRQKHALKLFKGSYIWVAGVLSPRAWHSKEKDYWIKELDLWVDQWLYVGRDRPSLRRSEKPEDWPDIVETGVEQRTSEPDAVPEASGEELPPAEETPT